MNIPHAPSRAKLFSYTSILSVILTMPILSHAQTTAETDIVEKARLEIEAAKAEILDAELVIAKATISKAKAKIAASEALIANELKRKAEAQDAKTLNTDTSPMIDESAIIETASSPIAAPTVTETEISSADSSDIEDDAWSDTKALPTTLTAAIVPLSQSAASAQPANLITNAPPPSVVVPAVPLPTTPLPSNAEDAPLPELEDAVVQDAPIALVSDAVLVPTPIVLDTDALETETAQAPDQHMEILGGLINISRSAKTAPIDGCAKTQTGLINTGGFTAFTCEKLLPNLPIEAQQTAYEEYQDAFLEAGWDVHLTQETSDTHSAFKRADEHGCETHVALKLWKDRSMNETPRDKTDREAYRQIVFKADFNGQACQRHYPAVLALSH